ncbi:hypothetical protein Pmani_003395, partial [Petrolisthes manimaculis]
MKGDSLTDHLYDTQVENTAAVLVKFKRRHRENWKHKRRDKENGKHKRRDKENGKHKSRDRDNGKH